MRPADLAIAVAYVRLRYSDTGISIESFTKSVKDAGNIVHNCLRFDAIAIPLMNNRKEKYYYSVFRFLQSIIHTISVALIQPK